MASRLPLIVVLVMCCTAMAAELVTIGDAKADFSSQQYRPCLAKIARLLSGPSAKMGTPEHYDLLMLRGECMLQLKQASLAADAFDSAARSIESQGDLKKVAAAKAVVVLIRQSPGLRYKPAGNRHAQAIDIVDRSSRNRAMAALLDDRIAALTPQVDKAIKGTSLVPMQKLLPALKEAYLVELASTGETARVMPIAKSMGTRARSLINNELPRLSRRVDELYELASEPTIVSSGRHDSFGYRGLTTPERDELRNIAGTLLRIGKVAEDARQLSRQIGGASDAWANILANCNECKERAQRAYDRRY